MTDRAIAWSYGGGTQSIAIALLVWQGKLLKPDVTIIADTGREATETWEYTERYVQPLLDEVDVTIERATHDLATVDLYSKKGELLLPAFTQPGGQMQTFCSVEWKRRVVRRYLRSRGYGPRRPVTMWLGISTDEIGRAKTQSDVRWAENGHPLLDLGLSRADCRQIILDAGLPEPPKSSCWMCPWRRDAQWIRLRDHYPQDFAMAVALDESIRAQDADHNVYLWEKRQPLATAVFTESTPRQGLEGEVEGCETGMCWT